MDSMTRRSLDGETPMTAPLATRSPSQCHRRISTIKTASPSFASLSALPTNTDADTIIARGLSEIKQLSEGFDRLENKHLQSQRFIPNQQKSDDMSKVSLGAKVQRALDRRMTNQDAVFRVRKTTASKASSINSLTTTLFDEKKAYSMQGDLIKV